MTVQEAVLVQVIAVGIALGGIALYHKTMKEEPIVLPYVAQPSCVEPRIILGGSNGERSL